MKKRVTLLALLFSIFIFSQEFKIEEVVKVDSLATKDELYNRARIWAKDNYKFKNNIITTEDREVGEISGVGSMDYRADKKYKGPITYKFNIFLKEGRFKYVFHSFDHKGSRGNICNRINFGILTVVEYAPDKGRGIAYDTGWTDVKLKASEKILILSAELKAAMNKKYEGSNDW